MAIERVVCLNCIDGRTQLPVINWIKETYNVENVDMVTEPGIDGLLANKANNVDAIIDKVKLSIRANDAKIIFICGHHDCKGNPVDDKTHKENIDAAAQILKQQGFTCKIVGLWVSDHWNVVKIITVDESKVS